MLLNSLTGKVMAYLMLLPNIKMSYLIIMICWHYKSQHM